MNKLRIPFDNSWKGIVTDLFSDCAEMFLPDLFAEMNLGIPPKFLEQELQALIKDKTFKIADKIVEVTLISGEKRCVIVHIEFEAKPEPIIGERMFRYYRRIYDTYGNKITALVIYTGARVPKVFDRYEENIFGTSLVYRFNTYQVRKQNEADLINNPNPFAIVVLACWYIMKSEGNDSLRLSFKEKVYELARNRNYSLEKTLKLLIFVEELVKLPDAFEDKFQEAIYKPVKDNDMYVTDASRRLANTLTKGAFGESYSEVKAQIMTERAKADAERAKADAERTKADAERTNAIIKLYTIAKLSVQMIADTLELDIKFVRKVLRSEGLSEK